MAPSDRIRTPYYWRFVPVEEASGNICWRWEAVEHSGMVAMRSQRTFDTFTECRADAMAYGYRPTPPA